MADFVKVAKTNEIEPGQARLGDVKGKSIALFNVDGQFFARQHVHAPRRALGRGRDLGP